MLTIIALRDIAIILLALESILIGVLLTFLILEVRSLTRMLQTEVKPLLNSVNETAATVKGTTQFLSSNVAEPMIRVASVGAGISGAIQSLRRKD